MTDAALTHAGRERLHRLASAAVYDSATGARTTGPLAERAACLDELTEPRGAFVTLQSRDATARRLRGCIGNVLGDRPLYRNVLEMATKAASEDPRFPPLTAAELSGLTVEVSALTPLRRVSGPDEIRVGRHGVELTRDGSRSVFLPRVAADRGWSVDELLEQLALKAGLARDAWRAAALRVFEAEVFGGPWSRSDSGS